MLAPFSPTTAGAPCEAATAVASRPAGALGGSDLATATGPRSRSASTAQACATWACTPAPNVP
eukprot:6292211-Pyramimonas_sp.AAC.1